MKKLLALFFCIWLGTAMGQNLVLNGDLEAFNLCPCFPSNPTDANFVSKPTDGTSDYFNPCAAQGCYVHVPDNFAGVQVGQCGPAYAGFFTYYNDNLEYREYVQIKLSQPLTIGTTYTTTFYVSLGGYSGYATNSIGAALVTGELYEPNFAVLSVAPEYYEPTVITDTTNWVPITFNFTATAANDHIIIGAFLNDANITAQQVPYTFTSYPFPEEMYRYGYYYLDNISVVEQNDILPADTTVCAGQSITLSTLTGETVIWSTGDTAASITVNPLVTSSYTILSGECVAFFDSVTVTVSPCNSDSLVIPDVFTPTAEDGTNDTFVIDGLPENSHLTVYNRWGNKVYESADYKNDWDGEKHSDGVYYYILNTPDGKDYHGTVTKL